MGQNVATGKHTPTVKWFKSLKQFQTCSFFVSAEKKDAFSPSAEQRIKADIFITYSAERLCCCF